MTSGTLASRRDVLSGRDIGRMLGSLARDLDGAGSALRTGPARTERLLKLSRAAMACRFELFLPEHAASRIARAIAALERVDPLEAQLSVYIASSDISRINAQAARRPVPVEPGLFGLLEAARRISEQTGGAFDVTAGPLIRCWGFYERTGRLPPEHELAAARACVGMHHVHLSGPDRTVRFARAGVELNLGAIGKGYALDRIGASLRAAGCGHFLAQAGASSMLACGDSGREEGWLVGIRHPYDRRRRLARLRLKDVAMSTSDDGQQYFLAGGRRYGHILDPRTGRPARGAASASALAPTAAQADALATAFYVMGLDAVREYCRQHPSVGAVLAVRGSDGRLRVVGINVERFELEIPG